ncbi:hypothetical protein FIU87_12740 [Bacillus sp. THAF10]|uniref:protein phosphatase 2C domain-containing protein n=1 Tax=Bacillus sp. THAF10 TaxID=2587848 RepID=UPI0012A7AA55|nr:protein phosphatase 2C domain-containing protein [Bacillus sp. THAF10]QFT89519.1 hypothetical protein FIU87_12740 [Bacillus sp. THAF10]
MLRSSCEQNEKEEYHMNGFNWVGSRMHYVDEISISTYQDRVTCGLFGGNSNAGQYKNEDGALLWLDEKGEWEFAIVLDAHSSAESADLVVKTMGKNKKAILEVLNLPLQTVFKTLSQKILSIFDSPDFLLKCQRVNGETACLIAFRKSNYLWWFSVGDCALLIYHPELARLGEYQLNHRSFFEWVGKESTFHKKVPTYSTGVKELRRGTNHILLTTDGLLECPNTSYHKPENIFEKFKGMDVTSGVHVLLRDIQLNNVRDSTTIISWSIDVVERGTLPSDYRELTENHNKEVDKNASFEGETHL